MSGKKSMKKMPSIRLGSGSGARGALKALKTGHHEDVPDEAEGGDGLPNKRTYMLLKRLYQTLDQPFNGEGLSWYDKVHSVKVDNAADLLYKTTWRDFFENHDGKNKGEKTKSNNRSSSSPSPAPRNVTEKQRPEEKDAKKKNEHSKVDSERGRKQEKDKGKKKKKVSQSTMGAIDRPEANLETAFEQMVQRVELLWMELKVSESEREFYQHTLCKRPCAGMTQLNSIAKYIVCLQDFRLATIDVLEAIDARERALAGLEDVTTSYLRRRDEEEEHLARANLQQQQRPSGHSTPVRGGVRSLRSHAQSSSRHGRQPGSLVDALGASDGDSDGDGGSKPMPKSAPFSPHRSQQLYSLLREDLVQALHELQVLSVAVVRAVQQWRHCLWRPLPFVWQGVDYLQKMQVDAAFLDGEEGPGALLGDFINTIPLSREDLQGVLFGINPAGNPRGPPSGSGVAPDPNQGPEQAAVITILDLSSLSEEGRKNPLRQWFVEGRPEAEEMDAVSAVVQEEGPLLAALARERVRLAQEGVFIPSLRVLFEREAAPPPPVPPRPSSPAPAPGPRSDEEKNEQQQQQQQQQQQRDASSRSSLRGRGGSRNADSSTKSSSSSSSQRRERERERGGISTAQEEPAAGALHPDDELMMMTPPDHDDDDDDDAVMLEPPPEIDVQGQGEEEEEEESAIAPSPVTMEAPPSPSPVHVPEPEPVVEEPAMESRSAAQIRLQERLAAKKKHEAKQLEPEPVVEEEMEPPSEGKGGEKEDDEPNYEDDKFE